MDLTVAIPDDFARLLEADGEGLERRVLEALAAEAYRAGRMTHPELRRLLSFETHAELDGFLKARGLDDALGADDVGRDIAVLDRLGP